MQAGRSRRSIASRGAIPSRAPTASRGPLAGLFGYRARTDPEVFPPECRFRETLLGHFFEARLPGSTRRTGARRRREIGQLGETHRFIARHFVPAAPARAPV